MKQLLLLFFLFIGVSAQGQIKGFITDMTGEPMPYVSIYIQGGSTGTTTNQEGYYQLKLDQGQYKVVFQFIGYSTIIKTVDLGNEPYELNVQMESQSMLLDEVVVAADAEDPAYRVIRAAIAKRKYHRDLVEAYSCDVYVKGNNKMEAAPEKIMGMEVGDLDGTLDSNRQGIVYLSESVSKLYFQAPDEFKEIVTSSKVSGDDKGYSFNSAKEMDFNVYENTTDLNRAIISPIANNALRYYRYRLEGTYYDSENRLINKIAVLPKRSADPVFYGHIYIIEDQWNVHSLNLGITEQSSQLYFLDSLTFDQVFIPIEENVWRLFNNSISFKFEAFGFRLRGAFTAVYSNYDLSPTYEKKFFNSVSHKVEKESNERDSAYWESIRPVPLTVEEQVDYVRKDSIFEVRNSPEFLDSIDRDNNKFGIGNLVGGYSHQSSQNHTYWDISSALNGLSFNTVQGVTGNIGFDWRKYFDEEETRRLLWFSTFNYGFSEKKLRAEGQLIYRPNRVSSTEYAILGGSRIQQFNGSEPISSFYNTLYSLLDERNYAKYYAKNYIVGLWSTDITPGVILTSRLTYENRQSLINNSDWVIFDSDDYEYTSNDPLNPTNFGAAFEDHQALLVDLRASIRFGQKYTMFPDRRFSDGYKGPNINLGYRAALQTLGGDVGYHHIYASLEKSSTLGVFGQFEYYINGGTYFGVDDIQFVDFKHFVGSQILYGSADNYQRQFLRLPYYDYSTSDQYLQVHFQHHFNGWILDKVPGVSQLGLSLVAGAKYLYTSTNPDYYEFHVGLDKIGWKLFKIFRVDAVLSVTDGRTDWGARLAIGFNN